MKQIADGPRGDLYELERCPDGFALAGFQERVVPPKGRHDDIGGDGVRFLCADVVDPKLWGDKQVWINPGEGFEGEWKEP